MKHKISILLLVIILMLVSTGTAFAGAKNAVFTEWYGGDASGYWKALPNGVVHLWSYNRPKNRPQIPIHAIFKPLDKFPNADCDDDAIFFREDYTPYPLYNVTVAKYKSTLLTIFPEADNKDGPLYYMCQYPIE